MATPAVEEVKAALAQFTSSTRLYEVSLQDPQASLLVEAFAADEGLQSIGQRDVILLSTDACLNLAKLLGQQAVLKATLADGTRTRFTGLISEAAMLGSVGGLTRFLMKIK